MGFHYILKPPRILRDDRLEFSNNEVFLYLMIVFIFANSEDPD